MMRVMITGCKGQVGNCLVKQLTGKADLLVLDSQQLDITDPLAVSDTVEEFKPDYIINAAAHTAVDRAEEEIDASYAINCDGPKYLAEAAQKCGSVMLHISTDYVFDGEGRSAYSEIDHTNPQSVYGESKLAGELAVIESCEKHLILRTAWVFGERGNNFVNTMLRLAESRNSLNVVGDQFGGPTYAGDIAGALIKMIEAVEGRGKKNWGIYHFSGMPYVSWFEFAQSIFSIAEMEGVLKKGPVVSEMSTSAYPTVAKRPANSRMDCSKVEREFGVEPSDWLKALKNIQAYK